MEGGRKGKKEKGGQGRERLQERNERKEGGKAGRQAGKKKERTAHSFSITIRGQECTRLKLGARC